MIAGQGPGPAVIVVAGAVFALPILGYMVAPAIMRAVRGARDSHPFAATSKTARRVAGEVGEWWRYRNNPAGVPVASTSYWEAVNDEEIWAYPLSVGQLERKNRWYRRLAVKGKLQSGHLVGARAVRGVLVRRRESDAASAAYAQTKETR